MAESSRQKVQEKRFGVTLWDLFLRREWFLDSDLLFTKCIDSRKGLFMGIILKCEFFLWQFDCSEVTLYGCRYVKIQLLTNYLSTSIKRTKRFGGYLSIILTHTSYHECLCWLTNKTFQASPNVYTVPPPRPTLPRQALKLFCGILERRHLQLPHRISWAWLLKNKTGQETT